MEILRLLVKEFRWWLKNLTNSKREFYRRPYDLTIFSDASKIIWGAHNQDKQAKGFWNSNINFLELLATLRAGSTNSISYSYRIRSYTAIVEPALNGLKSLAKEQHDCSILLRIDNVTAVACINKMGSVKYKALNNLAAEIWRWCESRNIYVFGSYINSADNKKADGLSRSKFNNTEFELNPRAFQRI
ncbi:hypothetical protein NQ315_006079, partial [Exocentrus adspersus]